MKTVPSLVASSTVGVAAVGLAFGKPAEQHTPARPSSNKRKAADLADHETSPQGNSSPTSRPGTSTTIITPDHRPSRRGTTSTPNAPSAHPQPLTVRTASSGMSGGRRLSIVKSGEFLLSHESPMDEHHRRDSMSSRGSWMKRLSGLPSAHNSPRSSVGPDSPSIQLSQLSHASAAPILSTPTNSPTQLPPNKLVKRATSIRSSSDGPISHSRSRTQLPTLRRPATSHQRSVTLQQQFKDDARRSSSFDTPTKQPQASTSRRLYAPTNQPVWRQYFTSRTTKLTKERSSAASSDGGIQNFVVTSRRVVQDNDARPTLVKPGMITASNEMDEIHYDDEITFESTFVSPGDADNAILTELEEPQKRARRSLSMHFSSPSSWITRSGSLRGKRKDAVGGGKRYSSAPNPTIAARSTTSAHGGRSHAVVDSTMFERKTHTSAEHDPPSDPFALSFHARTRNSSSPLPPLSRLSSFNLDLARLGLASSSSSAPRQSPTSSFPQTNTTSTSITSTSHTSPNLSSYLPNHTSKTSRTSELVDRASTLVGSDNDTKGFTSGDEDEMDFQSETVYDSLRSGATSSVRSHSTPLESMFDESPPSLGGQSRKKRLSIHEMLVNGGFQDGNTSIVEEDEGVPTPVKGSRSVPSEDFDTPIRFRDRDNEFPSSPPSFTLATKDFGRLSLDDEDEDEDWTRDDENLEVGNLSPPSSMNSRKFSPSLRAALADVTHSGSTNGNLNPNERPKSNLFDWAEPSSAEKIDHLGHSPRPRTSHVKQSADGRSGRPRRGPTALHVRSQSVPVVPDVAGQRDISKLTPKFGTWGLGAKAVSEDWDNDFDFDGADMEDVDDGEERLENSGMLVPPAIQASQANVVGHVGQIREVCLLVEDLKRLRLLAKEKGLLEGRSAPLWKEAEGIIALAAPDDEEEAIQSSSSSPSSNAFDDAIIEREPDDVDVFAAQNKSEASVDIQHRHGRAHGLGHDGRVVRRKSVFSPEDDIFGVGPLNSLPSKELLRPPSTSTRHSSIRSASDVARSVMETMHQHRSTSDPLLKTLTSQASNKMPFDTTSLRDLVHRANVLTRTLSDIVRRADGGTDSPDVTPHRDSSPAFTRVFTDPMQSPPKQLPRSQSNNSVLSGSIDSSPTRSLGQRMHMMTVV